MHGRFFRNGTWATVEHLTDTLSCLTGLETDVSERGKGQARRILKTIVEEADAEGIEMFLQAEPHPDTDPGKLRALYQSVGFIPAEQLTTYRWRKLRKEIGPCYREVIMYRPKSGRSGNA